MGQLISRALRRFTQSRDQLANQHQSNSGDAPARATDASGQRTTDSTISDTNKQENNNNAPVQSKVQSIPVGQSIDSADYAIFKDAKSEREEQLRTSKKSTNGNTTDDASKQSFITETDGDNHQTKQPEVEEAVIKIQALVRGHLTRKALKADAQQQGSSSPSLNQLGQSQFDDESLMKNPLCAVLSSNFPLNMNYATNCQRPKIRSQASRIGSPRPHLESIAEDAESAVQNSPLTMQTSRDSTRLRLSPMNESSARSGSRDSMSPVPSEANVSIDLNCDTPQSASIDISDHNIKPTDRIASVLYHRTDTTQTSPMISIREDSSANGVGGDLTLDQASILNAPPTSPTNANSSLGSPDSAEAAAAIRIQSAFRGYKTRKHSPYRRRSPSGNGSPTLNGVSTKRGALRQQDATIENDDDQLIENIGVQPEAQSSLVAASREEDEGIEEDDEAMRSALEAGRRLSRQRQRDLAANNEQSMAGPLSNSNSTMENALQAAASVEEFTTTEDNTVRELANDPSLERRESNHLPSSFADLEVIGAALASVDDQPTESIDQSLSTVQDVHLAPVVDVSSRTNENSQIGGGLTSNIVSLVNESDASIQLAQQQPHQRPSIGGTKSEGGQSFELDTDSSNLGAALSLNEDTSEHLQNQMQQQVQLHQPSSNNLEAASNFVNLDQSTQGTSEYDDDKSFGANLISEELESEARKLVDELNETTRDDYDVDESGQLLERQQEEAAAALVDAILDDDEQRVIELESDDIEKRDPRGQASEERVKSPQIKTEQPSFSVDDSPNLLEAEASPAGLTLDTSKVSQDNAQASGSSSPALCSSNGGSSGSGDDEAGGSSDPDKETSGKSSGNHQQQPSEHGVSGGKQAGGNKANKRKNRNKKKGNRK